MLNFRNLDKEDITIDVLKNIELTEDNLEIFEYIFNNNLYNFENMNEATDIMNICIDTDNNETLKFILDITSTYLDECWWF